MSRRMASRGLWLKNARNISAFIAVFSLLMSCLFPGAGASASTLEDASYSQAVQALASTAEQADDVSASSEQGSSESSSSADSVALDATDGSDAGTGSDSSKETSSDSTETSGTDDAQSAEQGSSDATGSGSTDSGSASSDSASGGTGASSASSSSSNSTGSSTDSASTGSSASSNTSNTSNAEDEESLGALSAADAEAAAAQTRSSSKSSTRSSSQSSTQSDSSNETSSLVTLDNSLYITSVDITYELVLDPEDEDYDPDADPIEYDPDSDDTAQSQPTISKAGGEMILYAQVHMSDGSVISALDAGITWGFTEYYEADGETLLNEMIAVVTNESDGSGLVTATQAGDGIAILKCSSTVYPDFVGLEIPITIQNNSSGDSSSFTPAWALLMYEDESTDGLTVYYSGESRPQISSAYGEVSLVVALLMSDSSIIFSDTAGLDASWTIVSSHSVTGAELSYALATISADGLVSSLNTGNGYVVVECSLLGYTFSAKIYITGNDSGDSSSGSSGGSSGSSGSSSSSSNLSALTLTMRYTDYYNSKATTYSTSNLPEIVTEFGTVQFIPMIYWSNGTLTEAMDSAYKVSWTRTACTDFDGNPVNAVLAYISNDGLVTSAGWGNGIAYFTVSVDTGSSTLTFDVQVEIRGNEAYVSNVEVLNASTGEIFGDSSIDVSVSGNIHYFGARVTYNNGQTLYSTNTDIDGLSWSVMRDPSGTEEYLYATITQDGEFSTLSGFADCFVFATVVGGGIYGNDVRDRVRVYDGDTDEPIGNTSSITVTVITRSDYDNYGLDAAPSRTVTVTTQDIEDYGTYTDWFTYLTRGDDWGTMYARGISIGNFVRLCGIDPSTMQFISFRGSDGYGAETGFYSASTILSSRYRYSNYYMHAVSSSAAYLGQESVSAMIAVEYYRDLGNDPISGGYDQMTSDQCLRLMLGMQSPTANNARLMVRLLSEITIIVDDTVDDPEPLPENTSGESEGSGGGGGGGSGTGSSGSGTGSAGGVGTGEGSATSGSGGGSGEGAWGSSGNEGTGEMESETSTGLGDSTGVGDGESLDLDSSVAESDSYTVTLLEELAEEDGTYNVSHYVNLTWRLISLIAAILAVLFGGLWTKRQFDIERSRERRLFYG